MGKSHLHHPRVGAILMCGLYETNNQHDIIIYLRLNNK